MPSRFGWEAVFSSRNLIGIRITEGATFGNIKMKQKLSYVKQALTQRRPNDHFFVLWTGSRLSEFS
jgi:hypothetical protein